MTVRLWASRPSVLPGGCWGDTSALLGTCAQVKATHYSPTSVLISWASCHGEVRPTAAQPRAPGELRPEVTIRRVGSAEPARSVASTTTAYSYVPVGGNVYTSPYLSHVLVKGLKPGEGCAG